MKSKASYVWRIHDGNVARDPEWNVDDTAMLLEMGRSTTFQYLEFRANPAVFKDKRVSGADSFRTAKKQFDIVKALQKREMIVEFRRKKEEERAPFLTDEVIVQLPPGTKMPEGFSDEYAFQKKSEFLAERIAQQGDCREWIKKWPG